jgi:hypothetical protein
MTPSSRPEPTPASRLIVILGGLSLLAAVAGLLAHVWLGLAFTDEMQYYGEIASLTRTGRFFQDDMFVQQLGYLFVLPFFKVHALVFPDQSYLVLFGRLLLLAGYLVTGGVFWRMAGRRGGFSPAQKVAALAVLFAWVPFQIFALSYNTSSYLLGVALAAAWIGRDPARPTRYAVITAALLTALTYTYPPAGLVLILVAVTEASRVLGPRAALELLGATAVGGGAVLGIIAVLQGKELLPDLLAAAGFSRAFGVADVIMIPSHFASWLVLVGINGGFLLRRRLGSSLGFSHPGKESGAGSWIVLAVMVAAGAALLGLAVVWRHDYFPASLYLGLLMVVALSIAKTSGVAATRFRQAQVLTLLGGSAVFLVVSLRWGTGYFASGIYFVLLVLLAAFARPDDGPAPTGLALIGLILGTVYAFTSGNGVHNFGIGAAAVIPWLALHVARGAAGPALTGAGIFCRPAVPVIVGLVLLNGALHPYGEQRVWHRFEPITGVPAFRDLWTSPVKVEAVRFFQAACRPGTLQGKRVLVIGPQPWLYFVLGGQAATPMIFLHYLGKETAYELVAQRLFRGGMPDAILVTSATTPRPIALQLGEWTKLPYSAQSIAVPEDFNRRFGRETAFYFSPETILLRRAADPP